MRLVRYLPSILILLLFGLCLISLKAQAPATSPTPTQANNLGWLGQLDTYAKVIGGVVAGLGTLFGLPLVILNFRKTRAEIRKLELEAAALYIFRSWMSTVRLRDSGTSLSRFTVK